MTAETTQSTKRSIEQSVELCLLSFRHTGLEAHATIHQTNKNLAWQVEPTESPSGCRR